ncbi:hypothetical protein Rifp1Sym_cw00180 [endosymbiont of Riftia pachyptila (vent Ph05)]|nr:hypothetical protein Rifp1Sym_cw00180 [endosymbiont of Riftia pachyptila (vent Ph05)]
MMLKRTAVFLMLLVLVLVPLGAAAEQDAFDEAEAALLAGDYDKAFRKYLRLARDGSPKAQYELGLLYLHGKGVRKKVDRGVEWLKEAANNGSYLAANELGNMYISGKDVLRDEKQAIHWLQQAEKINESTNEADVECE